MRNVRTIAQPFLLGRRKKFKNTFTAENKIKWWRGGFVSKAPTVVTTVFAKIQN
jgi:hypothetical protein